MPGQQPSQLLVGVELAGVQDLHRRHDEARCAEAALNCGLLHKCLLNIRELPVRTEQALQRLYLLALCPDRKVDAGVEGLAVDQHVAGAALSDLAAFLDRSHSEIVAEHVRETCADIHHLLNLFAVQIETDQLILCAHQASPPALRTASSRHFPAISTAMCWRKALDDLQEFLGLMSEMTDFANAS